MKKCLFFILSLLAQVSFAQKTEFGFHAGVCNYWGDLAPMLVAKETHPMAGVFARINLNHTWALRAELNKFTLTGTDANFANSQVRNLSFKNQMNEAALLLEFNYLKFGTHVLHEHFTSYVFVGMGVFTHNPQGYLNGVWYDLRNYRTENVAYSTFGMAIPFGIGIKYMFNNRFAFESQLGFRKTFTDYLDDVSGVYPDIQSRFSDGGLIGSTLTDRSIEKFGMPQFKKGYKRGDPGHNDWYMNLSVGFSMRLRAKGKCPRFF